MVFRNDKTAKFLERTLVMIPTAYEKYDANHVSLVFFSVLGLVLLNRPVPEAEITAYVDSLFVGNGYKGSCSYGAEPHLPSTYFCLGIRRMLGLPPLPAAQAAAIRDYIPQCQLPSGLFRARAGRGDASIRHSYTAHAVYALLANPSDEPRGDAPPPWIGKSLDYMVRCQNYEGGMGDTPEQESHLGLTYCAVASLRLANCTDRIPDVSRLLAFVGKRLTCHNGRPNKPADVCYSFWALGTARCLGVAAAPPEVAAFLTTTGYDDMLGGFWKTPETHADPYHTALALCALSLLDAENLGLRHLDPVLCLPITP